MLLLFLLVGCSAYSFNPIWQLCGVTISDTEENSASLYDGSEHTFVIDLDYDQSYSLDILRTEDSSIIDNYLIEFICNGEDILREYHDSGFYVLKDGSTYIFSNIPSTEQRVDVIISQDGAIIGRVEILISKDLPPRPSVPSEPIEIKLFFDADAENPEIVSILSEEEISGLEIYYTLDGTDPTKEDERYSGSVDLSGAEGNQILKAVAYAPGAAGDIIVLDCILKENEYGHPVYLVYSEKGLNEWAEETRREESEYYYSFAECILGKDIELSDPEYPDSSNWIPVSYYGGTFNGRGHTISNLIINMPDEDHVGLFGMISDGMVIDLNLKGVRIQGDSYVGGIAGNLSYAYVHGNGAVSGKISGKSKVGGISGQADYGSAISGYNFEGFISATSEAGGIAGVSAGTSENCINYATIKTTGNRGGGLQGYSFSGSDIIVNSQNYGTIQGNSEVGGIIGYANDTDIIGCMNIAGDNGNIISGQSSSIGGICGVATGSSKVEYCSNNMPVSGSATSDFVGGIVGKIRSYSSISACYNSGSISGSSKIGGIVGANDDSPSKMISACYNTGESEYGIMGGESPRNSDFTACYWLGSVSTSAGPNGVQAVRIENFDDWYLDSDNDGIYDIQSALNAAIAALNPDSGYRFEKGESEKEPYILVQGGNNQ